VHPLHLIVDRPGRAPPAADASTGTGVNDGVADVGRGQPPSPSTPRIPRPDSERAELTPGIRSQHPIDAHVPAPSRVAGPRRGDDRHGDHQNGEQEDGTHRAIVASTGDLEYPVDAIPQVQRPRPNAKRMPAPRAPLPFAQGVGARPSTSGEDCPLRRKGNTADDHTRGPQPRLAPWSNTLAAPRERPPWNRSPATSLHARREARRRQNGERPRVPPITRAHARRSPRSGDGSERLLTSESVDGRFAAPGHFLQVVEIDVAVLDVDIDRVGRAFPPASVSTPIVRPSRGPSCRSACMSTPTGAPAQPGPRVA
jgi:hypothetical protein